jgi:CRISPR/Cas system CSM-associated protein Csm2 small subunit
MPDSNEDSNKRVQKAVDEIYREREIGEKVNVAEKALQYRVHKDRIYRRLNGIGPRGDRRAVNTKLSAIQEAYLLEYIRILDEIGLSIRLN